MLGESTTVEIEARARLAACKATTGCRQTLFEDLPVNDLAAIHIYNLIEVEKHALHRGGQMHDILVLYLIGPVA